ncbi:MAG: hypothetical protein K9N48_01085 [Verrucomicrobia bacterium]|nr:hypothetical protein [Verrucomicrobiota bacterium]MCF7708250.1 hypothetical protein [Verrucomicrobiota bacterium]
MNSITNNIIIIIGLMLVFQCILIETASLIADSALMSIMHKYNINVHNMNVIYTIYIALYVLYKYTNKEYLYAKQAASCTIILMMLILLIAMPSVRVVMEIIIFTYILWLVMKNTTRIASIDMIFLVSITFCVIITMVAEMNGNNINDVNSIMWSSYIITINGLIAYMLIYSLINNNINNGNNSINIIFSIVVLSLLSSLSVANNNISIIYILSSCAKIMMLIPVIYLINEAKKVYNNEDMYRLHTCGIMLGMIVINHIMNDIMYDYSNYNYIWIKIGVITYIILPSVYMDNKRIDILYNSKIVNIKNINYLYMLIYLVYNAGIIASYESYLSIITPISILVQIIMVIYMLYITIANRTNSYANI